MEEGLTVAVDQGGFGAEASLEGEWRVIKAVFLGFLFFESQRFYGVVLVAIVLENGVRIGIFAGELNWLKLVDFSKGTSAFDSLRDKCGELLFFVPNGGLFNWNKGKLFAWITCTFIRICAVIKDAKLASLEVSSYLGHEKLILARSLVRTNQVIAADVHFLLLSG